MTEQPIAPEEDHDEEDVAALLARETQDGPGTENLDDLPPSDFESFTEADVEKDDDA